MPIDTPVLIVGGSLNGLSTAAFLSHHGVPCILVERRSGTLARFRFRGISARSMKLYRSAGLEDDIWAVTTAEQRTGGLARAESLAAESVDWLPAPWTDGARTSGLSPTAFCNCDQDQLEPVLVRYASRRGADIRFHTELVDLRQEEDRVRAVLRNLDDDSRHTIEASYLVAADGIDSPVRERLGIRRHGEGVLEHWTNAVFRTDDVQPALHGRSFATCVMPELGVNLVPREPGPWMLSIRNDTSGDPPTASHCRRLIHQALGNPRAAVDLVDILPWSAAALTAERFSDRRVFLVGDAAHVMPPTGGFGGNTGIHDAHNLAWKLAAVTRGTARPALLDTYDAERRPVARHTTDESLRRLRAWFDPDSAAPTATAYDHDAVMFGYRYASGAVADADPPPTPSRTRTTRAPARARGLRTCPSGESAGSCRLST